MGQIALVVGASLSIAFVVAALTHQVRRYATAKNILDYPNPRSAHLAPTPRGGGVAVVTGVLVAVVLAELFGVIPLRVAMALVGGGALVAGVGWIDDLGAVKAPVRLAAHVLAAMWAIAWLGWVTSIQAGNHTLHVGGFGIILTMLAIVWAINLYNFMDGLDGFASMQGTSTGLIGMALLLMVREPALALVASFIAAACAGFLVWNWPPAKIFMGDVGSGFLGYSLVILALASDRARAVPVIVWVIVFGAFLFDATVTVARRLLRGERVFTAHREHAYQRATEKPRTHKHVMFLLIAINGLLGAIAVVAVAMPTTQPVAILIAVGVLGAAYLVVERDCRAAATSK